MKKEVITKTVAFTMLLAGLIGFSRISAANAAEAAPEKVSDNCRQAWHARYVCAVL